LHNLLLLNNKLIAVIQLLSPEVKAIIV